MRGWLPLLLLALLLPAGCGFHPRGVVAGPPASLQPLWLSGLAEYHEFMRELRAQLHQAGTRLADDAAEAKGVLRLRLQEEGHVFSVNANNAAVEYEYLFTLHYTAEAPSGERLGEGEIKTRRIVYAPGGELLGRVREAEQRRRDVYAELASRLMQRLSAL